MGLRPKHGNKWFDSIRELSATTLWGFCELSDLFGGFNLGTYVVVLDEVDKCLSGGGGGGGEVASVWILHGATDGEDTSGGERESI